jgi:hypothetical protein
LPDAKGSRLAVILTNVLDAQKGNLIEYPLSKYGTVSRFMPDSQRIVTDVREYHLVSGRHELIIWEEDAQVWRGLKGVVQTKLDATESHGYAFAADGKTFRTVGIERDAAGAPTKLEVLEVDATTGKTLKSLMKVDCNGAYGLSPDGKKLAVLESFEKLVIYDLDRAAKIATHTFAKEDPVDGIPKTFFAQYLVFSPDGSRLVVSRAIGLTAVLNTATGEELPALEGIAMIWTGPKVHAFTGDGRLLAMRFSRYAGPQKGPAGGFVGLNWAGAGVTVWDTQTGKALKTWEGSVPSPGGAGFYVAFNPVRPLLAILEPNDDETRLGLWDFAAEVEKK